MPSEDLLLDLVGFGVYTCRVRNPLETKILSSIAFRTFLFHLDFTQKQFPVGIQTGESSSESLAKLAKMITELAQF